jgi:hypothetical protein
MAAVSALVLALVVAAVLVPTPRFQGVIVGGLIGMVAGLIISFVQHHLRRSGKLHREIRAWTTVSDAGEKSTRRFVLRILNEKDVGTALWNLKVVFYKYGKRLHDETPWETIREMASTVMVDQIELPSQVTVEKILTLELYSTDLQKATDADAIRIVADIPGGSVFEENLPSWQSTPVA